MVRINALESTNEVKTHPVQESSGELMTSWRASGRQGVALEHVNVLGLVLVELVVLSADGAHLERISVQLTGFLY